MSDRRRESAAREPYEKPALRTIDLVAEEVMAVGCKLPTGGGPMAGTCLVPQCFAPGS